METRASHTGQSTELAKRELHSPEEGLRVDVLDVVFDGRGPRLRLRVGADAAFDCPKLLLVVRSAGRVVGHKYVQPKYESPFGMNPFYTWCEATVSVRLQDISRTDGIRFELYDGDTALEEAGTGEGTSSQTYFLDDLADIARESQEEKTEEGGVIGSTIDETVSSAMEPVVKWGVSLTGLYLIVDNRELVSDLFRDLFTTNSTGA